MPDLERRKTEKQLYKKGYEIRFVAHSIDELNELCSNIQAVGLKSGRPFAKSRRWILPIYGREAIELFVKWVDEFGAEKK